MVVAHLKYLMRVEGVKHVNLLLAHCLAQPNVQLLFVVQINSFSRVEHVNIVLVIKLLPLMADYAVQ